MNPAESVRAFLTEEHMEAALKLEDFATKEMWRFAHAGDDTEGRVQARQAVKVMGRSGWLSCLIPRGEAAGPQDCRTLCLFREAVAGVSPLADALYAVQGLGAVPLLLEGSLEQQAHWLPKAARGEVLGAFAMTEPEAGSDVANIQTRALKKGDGYRLTGKKWLISNAGIADYYIVFASIDPEKKSRGIGAFLVPAGTPGLKFSQAQVLSAPHPLGALEFQDCPAELVCEQGFKLGMRTLDRLRVSVAAAACGMARRALKEALHHAHQRQQFGKPLAQFQLVQQKLAVMDIELEAARLLTYRAAWQRDHGAERNSREVAQAKAFATEAAQRIIDQSLQILGGRGMLADHPVEHLYRAVRALRIYEGTTEIQYLIIAKELSAYVDA